MLARVHSKLSAAPKLYSLFFAVPARTGAGMSAVVKELCRDTLQQLPRSQHASLCAVVELLLSPYAWEIFHSHWEVPPERITHSLLTSVQVLLDHFAQSPEALSPRTRRPPRFREADQTTTESQLSPLKEARTSSGPAKSTASKKTRS